MYALIITKDADFIGFERLSVLLGKLEFSTVAVASSQAGFKHLFEKEPDLIILESGMLPINGVEFLPLAHRLSKAPIIVIGGKGTANVVAALDHGADAYLTPEVSDHEFRARVRAVTRRS